MKREVAILRRKAHGVGYRGRQSSPVRGPFPGARQRTDVSAASVVSRSARATLALSTPNASCASLDYTSCSLQRARARQTMIYGSSLFGCFTRITWPSESVCNHSHPACRTDSLSVREVSSMILTSLCPHRTHRRRPRLLAALERDSPVENQLFALVISSDLRTLALL